MEGMYAIITAVVFMHLRFALSFELMAAFAAICVWSSERDTEVAAFCVLVFSCIDSFDNEGTNAAVTLCIAVVIYAWALVRRKIFNAKNEADVALALHYFLLGIFVVVAHDHPGAAAAAGIVGGFAGIARKVVNESVVVNLAVPAVSAWMIVCGAASVTGGAARTLTLWEGIIAGLCVLVTAYGMKKGRKEELIGAAVGIAWAIIMCT